MNYLAYKTPHGNPDGSVTPPAARQCTLPETKIDLAQNRHPNLIRPKTLLVQALCLVLITCLTIFISPRQTEAPGRISEKCLTELKIDVKTETESRQIDKFQ